MKTKILLLLLIVSVESPAQTRNEFWGRINIAHSLNKKWSVGIDMHHRRQANYRSDDKNIFHYQLGNYGRIWVCYQLPKQWTILLSPLGYFHNEDILNAACELTQTNELRITPGVVKSFDIGKIKNRNRFIYDIRFADFDKATHFLQSRFRLQNSFTIPLYAFNKNYGLCYFLSNELLVKKHKQDTGFDQNRLYNAFQWKFLRSDINLGYQWVFQKETGSTFHRNQLFIMLNICI